MAQHRHLAPRIEEFGVARSAPHVRHAAPHRRTVALALDDDLVPAAGRNRHAPAVLTRHRPGPGQRRLGHLAGRAGHRGPYCHVIQRHEGGIDHRGHDVDAVSRRHPIGREAHVDDLGHLIHQRTEHLAPERLVRRVIDSHRGVHLPHPRILRREHHRAAAAIALLRQHGHLGAGRRASAQQHGGGGLDAADPIDGRHRWQGRPAGTRCLGVSAELGHGQPLALRRRLHSDPLQEPRSPARRCSGAGVQQQRQRLADRRTGIAALGERARPPEHQHTPAAHIRKLRHHAQLITRERAGFDAAQHQSPIGKQFLAGAGKAGYQFVGRVDAEPQVFAVGGALQRHHFQLGVVSDGPAQELQLEARLAFEIQNSLPPLLHRHEQVSRVVAGHHLAVDRWHPYPEDARPRLVQGQPHGHCDRPGRLGQRHGPCRHQAPLILDVEGDGLAAEALMTQRDVHQQRAALQHAARQCNALDLDVAGQRVAAHADREHRDAFGPQGQQGVVKRLVGGVHPVADQHEPRHRQPGQRLSRRLQGIGQARLIALRREGVSTGHRRRRRREAEGPDSEALPQVRARRAVSREERGQSACTARQAIGIRNAHRGGIIKQHADDVLLGHGGPDDEHGSQQAERQDGNERESQSEQHRTVAPRHRPRLPVHGGGGHRGQDGQEHCGHRPAPRRPAHVALREHRR